MAATPVGMKRFYAILAGVAVLGLGALGFLLSRPRMASIPANVTIQPSDTAGFRGYLKGSESAPVEITEYADYQCPFCQTFATLQMPTIEERLIKTGKLRWRYRDFPLAAARSSPGWRPTPRPAPTSRASTGSSTIASTRARASGPRRATPAITSGTTRAPSVWMSRATTSAWSRASTPAGFRPATRRAREAGVASTPTLLVGNRLYQGRIDSDAIRRLVDSLAPSTP